MSSPSLEEFEISFSIAKKVGFIPGEEETWNPSFGSVQQKSRLGLIFYTGEEL